MRSDQRQRSMQRKAHRRCAAALRITFRLSFVNHPRADNHNDERSALSRVSGKAQQREVGHFLNPL